MNFSKTITRLGLANCALMFLLSCIPLSGPLLMVPKILFLIYTSAFLIYSVFVFRSNKALLASQNFTHLIIFLIALFMLRQYSIEQGYHFGVDDGFYYSYLPSILLDGDLDFTNQLHYSTVPPQFFERRTQIGLIKNEYPIGPAIFWSPFFLLGHIFTLFSNTFLNKTYVLNGYSPFYINSVIAGNIFYCVLGIYFTYRFAAKYFGEAIGLISAIATWLCTSIYLYSTNVYLVSETLAMFSTALLLFISLIFNEKFTFFKTFLLGVISGLCVLVRLHNLVFLIFPVFLLASALYKEKISYRVLIGYFLGLFISVAPQLIVWKLLEGNWVMSVESLFVWWKSPRILELLFSARKGLFPWTPLVFFSCLGIWLVIKKNRSLGLLVLLVLVLNIYINSSQVDWWGSTSYGARRFTNSFVIFAIGFAAFLAWAFNRFNKVGFVVVILITCMLWNLNMFLTRSYRRGKLQYENADRFSTILNTKHYRIFLPVVYGLQFPVQFYYSAKFGLPLYGSENEFFIGGDILHFQSEHGNLVDGRANPIFGEGWQDQPMKSDFGIVRLTEGSESLIQVPLFFKNRDPLWMDISFRSMENNRIFAELFLNETPLKSFYVGPNGKRVLVELSRYKYPLSVNILKLRIQQNPERSARIALESLKFTPGDSKQLAN